MCLSCVLILKNNNAFYSILFHLHYFTIKLFFLIFFKFFWAAANFQIPVQVATEYPNYSLAIIWSRINDAKNNAGSVPTISGKKGLA